MLFLHGKSSKVTLRKGLSNVMGGIVVAIFALHLRFVFFFLSSIVLCPCGPFHSGDLNIFFSSGTFKNIMSLIIPYYFLESVFGTPLLFRCWICWINSPYFIISYCLFLCCFTSTF